MKKHISANLIFILLFFSSFSTLYAAGPQVVRVGAFNYYPAIFKDTDGAVKGFYVDALAAIARRENIRFEYIFGSWSDGLEKIKSGEVDVLTSVAFTTERAQFLDYATTPLLTVWGELYVPLDSEIDGIREVKNKKIAVMKGDFNASHFINLVKKFDIICEFVEMPGFDDVFKAVASKKVDAGVVSSNFGVAKQKKFGLRSTGIVFNPFDIFFAVAKNKNQNLLTLLDSYLANWKHQPDSPFNIARQKWSHESNVFKQAVPRWLVKVIAALGVLVVVAIVFVVLMRRQVQRSTADIIQSKAVLRESEAKFRSYIDNSPDGVFVADENGSYLEVNCAASTITGYTEVELLTMAIPDLVPPESFDTALNHFNSLKMNGFAYGELECLHKIGEKRWWSLDAVKLSETRFLCFVKDISERKRTEKTLHDKNTELESFTYTVSHDLKSPLITIQSYAGMIKKNMEAGQHASAQDDLKRIEDSALKMTTLLNDLLELSRVGKVMDMPSQVDMNHLIMDTLEQLAGTVTESQVKITLQSNLPTVRGDRKRILEVMQNLLENAIKYMGGQAEPRIEIGVRNEGKENVFFVYDNGKGIEERFHEKIFDLFSQLDSKSEGTGIGLALVKRAIEAHGGRVWVESDGAGKGSRFCFVLPDYVSDKSE